MKNRNRNRSHGPIQASPRLDGAPTMTTIELLRRHPLQRTVTCRGLFRFLGADSTASLEQALALALSLAVGTLAFLLTAFLMRGPEAATQSGWTARIVSLRDTRNRSP
jgi:hypothetical protein